MKSDKSRWNWNFSKGETHMKANETIFGFEATSNFTQDSVVTVAFCKIQKSSNETAKLLTCSRPKDIGLSISLSYLYNPYSRRSHDFW